MQIVARVTFAVLSLATAWGCTVDYHAAPPPPAEVRLTEREWAVINELRAQLAEIRTQLDQTRKQLADTRAEINSIRSRVNTTEGAVQQMRGGEGGESGSPADVGSRLAALENEVRTQRELLKVREDELRLLRDTVLQPGAAPAQAGTPGQTTPPADAPTASAQPARAAVSPASDAVQQAYENAWRRLRERDYRGAIEQFKKFVEEHSDSRLADNAQYWIGESHYALREFDEAILEFDVVRKKYGDGDKAPAAWLKIGYAFAELGNHVDARLILQEVINRYPTSREAEKAREKILSLDT